MGVRKECFPRPGHPLYLFSGDHEAGEANGQGLSAFGGAWYVPPAGKQITRQSSSSGSGGIY